MNTTYLEPTEPAAVKLFTSGVSGPVIMLNLLRFRETADYTDFPHLAPDQPISGRGAFDVYMEKTEPLLEATGGKILLLAQADSFLIGPADETWDLVMLISQATLDAFRSFATHAEYQATCLPHRTAALVDSRLLPLTQIERQADWPALR